MPQPDTIYSLTPLPFHKPLFITQKATDNEIHGILLLSFIVWHK